MHIFRHRQNIYRRRQRKAQTSIFVILGIFMFIAMVIGFFVYSNIQKTKAEEESKKASDLSLQAEEVEKFVNECIRKASFEGLKQLGQTGGYLEIPTLINFKGTSYWHLDSVNIQPFLNQTQERLLEHVNANVPKCVDDEKIKQLGFSIEKGDLMTSIEYGAADVTIKVNYPIKLSQQDFTKEFREFFNTFNIRYRAIFEAATEANEKTFDGNFDEKNPLKNLDYLKSLDFDVSYKSPEADILTFMIIDKKSITPENQNYAFNFAVKLGKSELKRATDLQNKSSSNPNVIPYSLFSVDKKAQLDISAGTTISFNGQDVKSISVQQSYPTEAVTKDVPVYKRNKDVVQKQDITYVIDNPVYSFEPTGILFNQFQKLTIFYPPEADDSKGMGILMGKNGFWIPIQSQHFPEQKLVATNILGFTEFTAVGCASQKVKEAVAEHLFEPNAGCYISLAIMIIAIALAVYLWWVFPVIGPGVTAGEVALEGFQITGTALTLGLAEGATAVAVGVAFTAISLTSTILGATTDVFYNSEENCQTFYPTCDQNVEIEVDEDSDADEGQCIPKEGSIRVVAGAPKVVCAQVESCGNYFEKMLCKSCSQKCSAEFY